MNTSPALEFSGLEKHFSRFALGPLNLTVPTGGIYGLIGPNGAGKTTLIDLIFGMGAVDGGSIRVCGFDHAKDEIAVKQHAGYVSPDLNFVAWGNVGRAIRFVKGFRPNWDDAYCSRLMEVFGFSPSDKIATLSFGSRTKLALLTAMAWHPQVLVLDEPTTGLDAQSKKAMFSELLSIVRDEARTIFISSHQLSDLERYTDRLAILHRGKLLAEGATAELVERHLQVEFTAEASGVETKAGVLLLEHDGPRWRAVVDTAVCPMASFSANGVRDVQSQPLTLEELFLAITK